MVSIRNKIPQTEDLCICVHVCFHLYHSFLLESGGLADIVGFLLIASFLIVRAHAPQVAKKQRLYCMEMGRNYMIIAAVFQFIRKY